MISNIFLKRARPVTEQALQGLIHSRCLTKSESNMKDGLDEHLSERQSTATQMQEVGRDARRLITYCFGELAGQDPRCIGKRQGFGPRQRVRLTLVRTRGDERIDCNLGHVPNIDESGSAGAGWHEEALIVNDVVSVGIAKVLSKEAGSDDGPSRWSAP